MRITLPVILVAGACAVAAIGFPRRIGLTASQADVSAPGDLILPARRQSIAALRSTRPRPSCGTCSVTCSSRRTSLRSSIADEDAFSCASHLHARKSRGVGHVRHCSAALAFARFCISANVTRRRDATARLRGLASPPSRCRHCRCVICAMRASAGSSMRLVSSRRFRLDITPVGVVVSLYACL